MAPDSDTLDTQAPAAGQPGAVVVTARDMSYRAPGYRSFEFATFEARSAAVLALVGSERPCVRDALLTVAGLVTPTEGSLTVAGTEVARAARGRRAARLAPGTVGLGVVTDVAPVDTALSAGEAVGAEMRSGDLLELLADFELATAVDQSIATLAPPARLRLSAALAAAAGAPVAVVDATDPFCAGVSARDISQVIALAGRSARATGTAWIVGTTDGTAAAAADARCALDLTQAEQFAAWEGDAL